MDSIDDEGSPEISLSPTWKVQKSSTWKSLRSRRKSDDQKIPDPAPISVNTDARPRSRALSASVATRTDYKSQWASAIISQDSVQDSFYGLREAADHYEKHATQYSWNELLLARADVEELGSIAAAAHDSKGNKNSPTGMQKFCNVALEYSKLLDVVFNESHEYVSIVWGVMKVLLVANVNHARLREKVEEHLISIGEQAAIVNHFIFYNPTEKIVESVGLLYADFSQFLRAAIRSYAKSKLATVFQAFTFPWETRFRTIVDRINRHFEQIKDTCSASSFGTTMQNNHLLHIIQDAQRDNFEQIHSHQQDEMLRSKSRQEVMDQMFKSFQAFEKNWPGAFDRLVQQQADLVKDFDASSRGRPQPPREPEEFLSNVVESEETVYQFRKDIYPGLADCDKWENSQTVRAKLMTTLDHQHCAKLLDHREMKAWMEKGESGLIWINSHQITKTVDWVSVLATNLIEYANRLQSVTALRHFCFGAYADRKGSNACMILQSFIFQMISKHRKVFLNNRSTGLVIQRLKASRSDLSELKEIFLELLQTANAKCLWIFVDHIDILSRQNDPEMAFRILDFLEKLVQDASITAKVFITARLGGNERLSIIAADEGIISLNHPVINVPRGQHRNEIALWARRSRRPHRLQEANLKKTISSESKVSIGHSSDDSSESDLIHEKSTKRPASASRLPQQPIRGASSVEDSESACSYQKDEFLSSEEEETDLEMRHTTSHPFVRTGNCISTDDDSDGSLLKTPQPDEGKFDSSSSSDSDNSDSIGGLWRPRKSSLNKTLVHDKPGKHENEANRSGSTIVKQCEDAAASPKRSSDKVNALRKVVTFESDADDSDY